MCKFHRGAGAKRLLLCGAAPRKEITNSSGVAGVMLARRDEAVPVGVFSPVLQRGNRSNKARLILAATTVTALVVAAVLLAGAARASDSGFVSLSQTSQYDDERVVEKFDDLTHKVRGHRIVRFTLLQRNLLLVFRFTVSIAISPALRSLTSTSRSKSLSAAPPACPALVACAVIPVTTASMGALVLLAPMASWVFPAFPASKVFLVFLATLALVDPSDLRYHYHPIPRSHQASISLRYPRAPAAFEAPLVTTATMVSQDSPEFPASSALLALEVTTEDQDPEANRVPTASMELLAKLGSKVLPALLVWPARRATPDFAVLLAFPAKPE